jgi:hypothetical protein
MVASAPFRGQLALRVNARPMDIYFSFSHTAIPIYYLTFCLRSPSRSAIVYNSLSGESHLARSHSHFYSITCRTLIGEYTISGCV